MKVHISERKNKMKNIPTISYGLMAEVVRTIEHLKTFNFTNISEIREKLNVYNSYDDYCDFTFSLGDSEIVIEGSYYIGDNGEITLSDFFSVFNSEVELLLEVD